jgi:hypothetical protein
MPCTPTVGVLPSLPSLLLSGCIRPNHALFSAYRAYVPASPEYGEAGAEIA